ncbi:hypothetical protein DPM13_15745 [Paracoccus mutanolyticus]|uniref:Acetyl-coenzyme A carboxylase carboxyl transferase subunit beta domain-containing protein n=1 Tax=Paracoccus mutanolyticus TaxID=1499308 RepID=A0ABN5MDN0_9RHOB|nr:hypothetical protein DPM13_15745 [Paracoccus mutanolyticus]
MLDPAQIPGVIPVDAKTPYDIREIIGRIVDGSDFEEQGALRHRTPETQMLIARLLRAHLCDD